MKRIIAIILLLILTGCWALDVLLDYEEPTKKKIECMEKEYPDGSIEIFCPPPTNRKCSDEPEEE